MNENQLNYRFDLYGAIYLLCVRWHSGQFSRGYRLLGKLDDVDYQPGLSVREGHNFENEQQRDIYRRLFKLRHTL